MSKNSRAGALGAALDAIKGNAYPGVDRLDDPPSLDVTQASPDAVADRVIYGTTDLTLFTTTLSKETPQL
jgi:hypothetical protein